MTSVPHRSSDLASYSLLDPAWDDDGAETALCDYVRNFGVLGSDGLGDGGLPYNSPQHGWWYNPAPAQRARERRRARDKEREQAEQLALTVYKVPEDTFVQRQQRVLAARDDQFKAELAQLLERRDIADTDQANRQARAAERSDLERRLWEIANEATEHWGATEIEHRLMWQMLRYMNLGDGRGQTWSAQKFAEIAWTPRKIIERCYLMLRERRGVVGKDVNSPAPDFMLLNERPF